MGKVHIRICEDQQAEGFSNSTNKGYLNYRSPAESNGWFEIGEYSERLEIHFVSTNIATLGFTVWIQGENSITGTPEDVDFEVFESNREITLGIDNPLYFRYRTIIKSGDYTDGTLNAFAYWL